MSQGEQMQDAHDERASGASPTLAVFARPSRGRRIGRRMLVSLCLLAGLLVGAASSQAALVHPFVSQLTGTPQEPFSGLLCGVSVDPGTGEVLVVGRRSAEQARRRRPGDRHLQFDQRVHRADQQGRRFGMDLPRSLQHRGQRLDPQHLRRESRRVSGGELEDEKEAVFVYKLTAGKYKFEKKLKLEGLNTPQKTSSSEFPAKKKRKARCTSQSTRAAETSTCRSASRE